MVLFSSFNHVRAYRVQHDIAADFEEMALFFHQNSLEPSLENMPVLAVFPVVCLGVDAVQMAHTGGKDPFRGFDEEVIVVVHEAVGVTEPIEAFYSLAEDREEKLAVVVIFEDGRPCVAARGNVIDSTGEFYA